MTIDTTPVLTGLDGTKARRVKCVAVKERDIQIEDILAELELMKESDPAAASIMSALKEAIELKVIPDDPSVFKSKKKLKPFLAEYRKKVRSKPRKAGSKKLSDKTVYTKASRINRVCSIYHRLSQRKPTDTADELLDLEFYSLFDSLQAIGRSFWPESSPHGICREFANIGRFKKASTVEPWYKGQCRPGPNMVPGLRSIELHLGLPSGVLTDQARLPKEFIIKHKECGAGETPKPFEWTHRIENQLAALCIFKTSGDRPDDEFVLNLDNDSFTISDEFVSAPFTSCYDHPPVGGGDWKTTPEGRVSSFKEFKSKVRVYMRFLRDEKKVDPDLMDLSMLLNTGWLLDYVKKQGGDGKFSTTITFLKRIGSLAKHDSGYLAYYHVPAEYCASFDGWQKYLKTLDSSISKWIQALKKKQKRLDGKRNVAFILQSDGGWDNLFKIRDTLLKQSRNGFDATLGHTFFNYSASEVAMLLRIGLECPLRCENWTQVVLLEQEPESLSALNQPAIFEVKSGRFRMIVPSNYLKNGIDEEVSDLRLSSKGGHTIDYTFTQEASLDIYRHLKLRKKHLDLLEVATNKLIVHAKGQAITPNGLGSRVKRLTNRAMRKIWPEKNFDYGINMHGLRHLCAMWILKHKPGRFDLVASALQDSYEMALSTYGGNDHDANYREIAELFESE